MTSQSAKEFLEKNSISAKLIYLDVKLEEGKTYSELAKRQFISLEKALRAVEITKKDFSLQEVKNSPWFKEQIAKAKKDVYKKAHYMSMQEFEDTIYQALVRQAKQINEKIKSLENPYPKDVFKWDNKNTFVQTRGRFNEFIYDVVENTKEKIIKIVKAEFLEEKSMRSAKVEKDKK